MLHAHVGIEQFSGCNENTSTRKGFLGHFRSQSRGVCTHDNSGEETGLQALVFAIQPRLVISMRHAVGNTVANANIVIGS